MEHTIAAISTSTMSSGGISIVRLSGVDAVEIADKIFEAKNKKKLKDARSHTIHYGVIKDGDDGTSTFINCAYIGMILSVSRYTAKLEEQRMHDAQVPMLIDAGNAENPEQPADSEAQTAAEPTAKVLNSDAEFE